jgi:lipopolysaccharide/colanic/teichoic acid biosynthesis glycosyltransferase
MSEAKRSVSFLGAVPAQADEPIDPFPRTAVYDVCTRALDLVFGVLGATLTLPLWAAIALAIRFDSPGPVMFRQTRLGRSLRPFRLYKFRTMYVDARATVLPTEVIEQARPETLDGIFLAQADDPRVTRLGKFLRYTSIDELPNLINIIRGEMTLVGPRPEVPEVFCLYDSSTVAKFAVKPGLTGLVQISGRGRLSFAKTVALDLEYVRTRSLGKNLAILGRTFAAVFTGRGAY